MDDIAQYLAGQLAGTATPLPDGTPGKILIDSRQRVVIAPAAAGDPSAISSTQLPAALGATMPGLSLSVVAAQSQPITWIVPVTTTPRALIVAWTNTTAYAVGELATNNGGKLYACITVGTSAGSGGPTGTTANITDGTAHWMYIAASVPLFRGSMILQVRSGSANTVTYSAIASSLAVGGKEIQIGTDGEGIFFGDTSSIWVVSSGTATASVVAYP